MEKMVEQQHGDPRVVADPTKLEIASSVVDVRAHRAGFVTEIDALTLGLAGVAMGAGRTRADQKVDPAVGIHIDKKPGDPVKSGEVVARLFLRPSSSSAAALAERVASAFTYGDTSPAKSPLVVDRLG
jgi:pyrimidine-nucleoside phosphorylase